MKNPTIINMEMTSGTRTVADFHPSVDPLVSAKMNRMKAAVRVETPKTSRCFTFAIPVSFIEPSVDEWDGMRNMVVIAMGMARMELR